MAPLLDANLGTIPFAVIPVLTGPFAVFAPGIPALMTLLAMLPALLMALGGLILSLLRPSVMKKGVVLLWRARLSVAIFVVACAGVVWAARALWPEASADASAAESGSDWPLFRGNFARTGVVANAQEPTRGRLNWIFRSGKAAFFSSPTVVGNRVYVTTATMAIIGDGSGEICCLDADTGAVVWHTAPDGYQATYSSPVVSGDFLVCGEGLHDTNDARVICLDLRPGHEGKVLWTHRTASHVECTPVVSDGCVYVGAGDDGYYCLKLEAGEDGQAQVVWHVPGDKYLDAETSLTVYKGRVYAGLGLGGKAIAVLDAKTGEELHRIATDYPVFSPPAIADGKLYVGMGNGDLVHSAEELKEEPGGAVWCVDLATLKVDWKFRTAQTVLGAVAVKGDHLYFASRDGVVYRIGKSGKLTAKFNAHVPILASLAVGEKHVYAVTEAGLLYALGRETLEPAWEFKAGSKPLVVSSPTVARGQVYVGTQFDGLLSVGESGEKRAAPVWPGHLGGPGAGGNLDGTLLPELGALHWQFPADQEGKTQDAIVTAPVAAIGNNILVPLAGGAGRSGLACLPADAQQERTPPQRWLYKTTHGVYLSPAASAETAFVVDGKPGQPDRRLHAIDLKTGQQRWQLPVADDASGVFSCTAEELFIQDKAGVLSRVDLSGAKTWSQPIGRLQHAVAAADALLVAAVVDPAALVALDRPTGRQLWRVKLDAAPTTSPVIEKSTVFLGTTGGLEVRSLVNGKAQAGSPREEGGVSSDLVVSRSFIAYISEQGQLVVISRGDPTVVRKLPGVVRGITPLVSRGTLLYAGKEGLMSFTPDDEDAQPVAWLDTSGLGRPTAPPVLVGSHVYQGRSGWGLVRLGAGR